MAYIHLPKPSLGLNIRECWAHTRLKKLHRTISEFRVQVSYDTWPCTRRQKMCHFARDLTCSYKYTTALQCSSHAPKLKSQCQKSQAWSRPKQQFDLEHSTELHPLSPSTAGFHLIHDVDRPHTVHHLARTRLRNNPPKGSILYQQLHRTTVEESLPVRKIILFKECRGIHSSIRAHLDNSRGFP